MPKLPRYRLSELLKRDANNLDLIRLLCACAVIFGHSFIVVNDPAYPFGTWDPCKYLRYEGVYSASVAVKIFFFLSGLLVTNSLLEKKSVTGYCIGRIFRIWPAYVAVLLVTALVIGPLFSTLRPGNYFAQREVYEYPGFNLLMVPLGDLPGVFMDNPLPRLVNGALWSLPYEVVAYLVLLVIFLLDIHRNFLLCTGVFLLVLLDPIRTHSWLFPWRDFNPQFAYLPPAFAFGAYLAVMKKYIVIGWETVAGLVVAFLLLKPSQWGPLVFFTTLFVAVLYAAGWSWVRRLKPRFDCSYGTFLWGFVIQQMVAARFADKGWAFNFTFSLLAAITVGLLSWHFIEKPSIALGHRLSRLAKPAPAMESVAAVPASRVVL